MRSFVLGIAAAIVATAPALADGLPVAPYSEGPAYQREVHTYERIAPRVVVAPRVIAAPIVTETVVVRRPVVVAPAPVVVEAYPVYPAPRVLAYGGYRFGPRGPWGHPRHFYGRW